LLGPLFAARLMEASAGGDRQLAHYQETFQPLLFGVLLAIVLTLLLRETGPKARPRVDATRPGARLHAE
jgi:hypothetical protein